RPGRACSPPARTTDPPQGPGIVSADRARVATQIFLAHRAHLGIVGVIQRGAARLVATVDHHQQRLLLTLGLIAEQTQQAVMVALRSVDVALEPATRVRAPPL